MVGRCTVWQGGVLCGRAVHYVAGRFTMWQSGVLCGRAVYCVAGRRNSVFKSPVVVCLVPSCGVFSPQLWCV